MSGGTTLFVDHKIAQRRILLWTKRGSPGCQHVRQILEGYRIPRPLYEVCEIDRRYDCTQIETYFLGLCLVDRREVPRLFIDSKYIGSDHDIVRLHESGELETMIQHVIGDEMNKRSELESDPGDATVLEFRSNESEPKLCFFDVESLDVPPTSEQLVPEDEATPH